MWMDLTCSRIVSRVASESEAPHSFAVRFTESADEIAFCLCVTAFHLRCYSHFTIYLFGRRREKIFSHFPSLFHSLPLSLHLDFYHQKINFLFAIKSMFAMSGRSLAGLRIEQKKCSMTLMVLGRWNGKAKVCLEWWINKLQEPRSLFKQMNRRFIPSTPCLLLINQNLTLQILCQLEHADSAGQFRCDWTVSRTNCTGISPTLRFFTRRWTFE